MSLELKVSDTEDERMLQAEKEGAFYVKRAELLKAWMQVIHLQGDIKMPTLASYLTWHRFTIVLLLL